MNPQKIIVKNTFNSAYVGGDGFVGGSFDDDYQHPTVS